MKIRFVQDPSGCAGLSYWLPYSQVSLEVGKVYVAYPVGSDLLDGVEVEGAYVEANGRVYEGLI